MKKRHDVMHKFHFVHLCNDLGCNIELIADDADAVAEDNCLECLVEHDSVRISLEFRCVANVNNIPIYIIYFID